MILCERGEIIDGWTFRDYIKTSANPSTPTIGHKICGRIFNFIDDSMPKRCSSKTPLKSIAMKYALKHKMSIQSIDCLMIEVDRLKSSENLSDGEIMVTAFRNAVKKRSRF